MAGAGFKVFTVGEVLTAANVNTLLMEQAVMVFDDAADRTAQLDGGEAQGMVTFLRDTNQLAFYDGDNWVNVGIDPIALILALS